MGHVWYTTDHPADDMRPAWSPDGKRIAFNSERDGNWEIDSDRYADARTAGTDAYNFELIVLDVNGAPQGLTVMFCGA